jgi:hypothetical protein
MSSSVPYHKFPLLFAEVSPFYLAAFLLAISVTVISIAFLCGLNWHLSRKRPPLSPYSKTPLRHASDISWYNAEKVILYLKELKEYDNRPFSLKRAALCRETGRLFPRCVNLWHEIKLDWSFIAKRYPGSYISWGSLSADQQREIREEHHSLEGFQTSYSCTAASPTAITPEYAFAKPGPLYVDLNTKILVGWKCVPDAELEVLIVQKPIDRKQLLPKISDITPTAENP